MLNIYRGAARLGQCIDLVRRTVVEHDLKEETFGVLWPLVVKDNGASDCEWADLFHMHASVKILLGSTEMVHSEGKRFFMGGSVLVALLYGNLRTLLSMSRKSSAS